MAEYKTHIEEKTGVTFIEITGQVNLDEQLAFIQSREFGERTLRVITDLRNASLAGLPRGVLAKLVRRSKQVSKPGIRGAFVFSIGDDFSKAKLVLAQMEVVGYEGMFKMFTDMEKAISWVRE